MGSKKCPECGSENINQLVYVMVECPAGWKEIRKTRIRSKQARILAVDWGSATFACPDCGCAWDEREKEGR